MTALAITITPDGLAAAVNAANTGTGPLVITQVALLSAPSTEIKRITTLGGEAIADNIIHVTITDETTDTYALTGLRLITDAGIIFATYHQPSPILEKGAEQLVLLSADIVLTSVPTGSVTIGGTGFAYPPATTTRQGVIEIATDAEAQAGTDTTRAITPAGLQAAAATTAPTMAGAAAVGTAKRWARADHVHPSDTSKANTSGTYAGLNVGYANSAGNAETLDGLHATDFWRNSQASQGDDWFILPNGWIFQFGRFTPTGPGASWVTFPIAFPADVNVKNIQVTIPNSGDANRDNAYSVTNTGFYCGRDGSSGYVYWQAIGKIQ